jgi:acyl-CoA thioesterase FadM
MNLFIRLLWLMLWSKRKSKLEVFDEGITSFVVLPTDLDVLLHMNNGVYCSLMDLGRIDFLIRSGLAVKLSERNWYPVAASESIRFKRSLKLFNRFQIATKTLGWDDRYFYIEQRFLSKGQLCSIAMVKARFLKKQGGTVAPAEVVDLIGEHVSPSLPEFLEDWNNAEKRQIERVEVPFQAVSQEQ